MESQKAGWRKGEWATLCGFGRSTLFTLPPDQQPKQVTIGKTPIIIESPAAYLERMARQQMQAAQKETA